jgi:uncharacterized 2Fe-2S/4Fe-4S cluster protein (DUF4445 family)
VIVPAESMTTPQRTQVEVLEIETKLEPPVRAYNLNLVAPSLSDQQADANRLIEALSKQHKVHYRRVDIDVLREFSRRLRSGDWHCHVSVRDDEVVAVVECAARQLGLTVDLGTTKIAGYLVALDIGTNIEVSLVYNGRITAVSCASGPVVEGGHIRDGMRAAAGAFGSYIDVGSAIDIGMLLSLPLERFRQVGNAAGAGARLTLVSTRRREESRTVASRVEYLELASPPNFMQIFTEATYLGRYRLTRGSR